MSGGGRNYNESEDSSDAWLRIAELYSSCNITHATDTIITILRLMKDRQLRGKHPYLESKIVLGMWETTLDEDLLWVPREKSKLKRLGRVEEGDVPNRGTLRR